MALDFAFILDPLPTLNPAKDSSIAMMRELARRGHRLHAVMRGDLTMRDTTVFARARAIELQGGDNWCKAGSPSLWALKDFAAVMMRQDPPFDFEYLTATWLLERAAMQGARVWNDPHAVRNHSEKLAVAEFPEFAVTTLVARHASALHGIIDELGDVILKPLEGMGGSQIFRVRADDPNRNVIVEVLTEGGQRTIMAQQYLPQIADGDKRILLIGGEVMPFALARIPKAGETRGNLAAGGHGVAMELTGREREIATALAPVLWARGLLIVGLDVIGGYLTEINVTSPTCMVEIEQQKAFSVAARVADCLEKMAH